MLTLKYQISKAGWRLTAEITAENVSLKIDGHLKKPLAAGNRNTAWWKFTPELGPICHLAHSASCSGSLSVILSVSLSFSHFSILPAAVLYGLQGLSISVQFTENQTGWRGSICALQLSLSWESSRRSAAGSPTGSLLLLHQSVALLWSLSLCISLSYVWGHWQHVFLMLQHANTYFYAAYLFFPIFLSVCQSTN